MPDPIPQQVSRGRAPLASPLPQWGLIFRRKFGAVSIASDRRLRLQSPQFEVQKPYRKPVARRRAAHRADLDGKVGREPGKPAHPPGAGVQILLNREIFTIDPYDIAETSVVLTGFQGREV